MFGCLNRLHFPFRAVDIRSHLRLSTHVDSEDEISATHMWLVRFRCTSNFSIEGNVLDFASCHNIVRATMQ